MRFFVRRDLDGFFGLFVDNLVQLLLILNLCAMRCGMTGEFASLLSERILPGAAVSILLGNLFYARQARRLAEREGRTDVTALPYGINTPSLLVYIFFVIGPAYDRTHSAEAAWRMGLLACLGSGLIEFGGAFVAGWVRRHTPRAALLSTLAGIAIGFISMTFALQIWSRPLVAMAPLAVVLVTYFSGVTFPLGIPGGLLAICLGTALAWLLPGDWTGVPMSAAAIGDALHGVGIVRPHWCGGDIWTALAEPSQWLPLLSVIVPMGLFNLIGSLQNIESAEAAGDRYDTRSSLLVNGIGSLAAACFGSCFPTTIYIGHPGWKGLGARAGYSTLNGVVVTLICLTGSVGLINSVIPLEAGIAIVLWIGVIITAQAFSATPRAHAPAVAVGLFPAIAAWGATVCLGAFFAATSGDGAGASGGLTAQALLEANRSAEISGFLLHGLLTLERGYILTCMIAAAISAFLIDRYFVHAAIWSLVAAGLTGLGLMHAYQLSGNTLDFLPLFAQPAEGAFVYRASSIAVGYALMAVVFAALAALRRGKEAGKSGAVHV